MNPDKYIDRLVFYAKLGNKERFKDLWFIYRPLLKDILFSFKKVYKFLKTAEFEMFQQFYIFFWRIIGKYSFSENIGFSYYLKINMIEMTIAHIKKEYNVEDRLLISQGAIESLIRAKELSKKEIEEKIKLYNVKKIFTTKQLQAVMMYRYFGMTTYQGAELLGIRTDTFKVRLIDSYKKMRNSYHGIRKENKKGYKYEEKAYEYKTSNGEK